MNDKLKDCLLGVSQSRLCIPAFDGKNSEVLVYKTPHHRDYKFDRYEKMVTVGLATAAAQRIISSSSTAATIWLMVACGLTIL